MSQFTHQYPSSLPTNHRYPPILAQSQQVQQHNQDTISATRALEMGPIPPSHPPTTQHRAASLHTQSNTLRPHRPHKQVAQTHITPHNPSDEPNQPWGSSSDTLPPPNNCRIYFQNINGLHANQSFTKDSKICQAADGAQIDIIALAETNTNWHDSSNRFTIAQQIRAFWPTMTYIWSASQAPCPSRYQPGGALMIAHDDWTTCIIDKTSDSTGLGRWTSMTITGHQQRTLTILTAYALPRATITTVSPNTVYSQQWHQLCQTGLSNPDPRRQFLIDLGAYVKSITRPDHELLLLLDANNHSNNNNGYRSKFMDTHNFLDTVTYSNQTVDNPLPSTYMQGSQQIDNALMTPGLAPYITHAGYNPFGAIVQSNHHGIVIDLDLQTKALPANLDKC